MTANSVQTLGRPTTSEIRERGEQHVLDELRRRGVRHGVERAGRRNDVVVGSGDDVTTVQVRVTSKGQHRGWLVTAELQAPGGEPQVYAFVDTKPQPPETFLIPAPTVRDVLRASHAAWLTAPGRYGQAHTDSAMRMIRPDYRLPVRGYRAGWLEAYRERWDLVGAGVEEHVR